MDRAIETALVFNVQVRRTLIACATHPNIMARSGAARLLGRAWKTTK